MIEPRRIWIGTSWKMNKTLSEALAFAKALAEADPSASNTIQRFVIPPFTSCREFKKSLRGTSVKVGAQNMHWSDEGAWTGEISPRMLTDCGLDLVELGHSERRQYFAETDETVGLKTEAAVRNGLIPLICIGETLAEKQAGQAKDVLACQVRGALAKLNAQQKSAEIIFAYEPVWAIGAGGTPASAEYAEARHQDIADIVGNVLCAPVPCLYGGSVNSQNCEELVSCPHIDGLFIGRAAWDAMGYLEILRKYHAILEGEVK